MKETYYFENYNIFSHRKYGKLRSKSNKSTTTKVCAEKCDLEKIERKRFNEDFKIYIKHNNNFKIYIKHERKI